MTFETHSLTVPGSSRLHLFWLNSGATISDSTSLEVVQNVITDRTSVVTPGYAMKRATGALPQNPFGFSEETTTHRQGSNRTEITVGSDVLVLEKTGYIGSWSESPPTWPPMETLMTAALKARVMDKIQDTGFNVATFAGEYGETSHMFNDICGRLIAAEAAARRGDAAGVMKALKMRTSKDFADLWLMIQYGIQPFLSDLRDAAKHIEKGATKEGFVQIHDRMKWSDTQSTFSGSSNSAGGLTLTSWMKTLDVSIRVKYSVTSPATATLGSLGLLNPLALGWELTKLSFVVDWLVGVGSYLGQLSSTFGKTFSGGSVTIFQRLTASTSRTKDHIGVGFRDMASEQGGFELVGCNRIPMITWPVTVLPAIKDPASISHFFTGLALLKQRRG